MKRVTVLAILTVILTFGSSAAYAFPSGPCNPTAAQSAPSGASHVQLLLLLVRAIAGPIV